MHLRRKASACYELVKSTLTILRNGGVSVTRGFSAPNESACAPPWEGEFPSVARPSVLAKWIGGFAQGNIIQGISAC